MAAPAFRAIGTRVTTATFGGSLSPGLPSGWQAGDCHLLVEVASLFGNSGIDDVLPTFPSPPAGWVEVLPRFRGRDTTVTANSRQVVVRVCGRIAEGGDGSPSVQTNTDEGSPFTAGSPAHQAFIIGASGTHSVAPWSAVQASNFDGDTTSLSEAGVTTTADESLVIAIVAIADDGIAGSSPAFTDPAAPTERLDETTTTGGDQFVYVATGEKATAGATGNFTLTLSAADPGAVVVIALKPPAVAADESYLALLGVD